MKLKLFITNWWQSLNICKAFANNSEIFWTDCMHLFRHHKKMFAIQKRIGTLEVV